MKKYRSDRIKKRKIYTFREIAESLGVHPRTVQAWRKDGLRVIDKAIRPYLVEGKDLKQYLATRKAKRKSKLSIHNFYCFRCTIPVSAKPSSVTFEERERTLGIDKVAQVIVHGKCSVCDGRVRRLSSSKWIDAIKTYYEERLKEGYEREITTGEQRINVAPLH